MRLQHKRALITGGAQGIGRAIAETFCREGGIVYLADINPEAGNATAAELSNGGAQAFFIQLDVGADDNWQQVCSRIEAEAGGIDILVNNAGITRDKTFKKMSFEEWHKVIDTNLSSVFNTCKIALPSMLEQKYGRIINISSVIGQAGGFGQTNYAAAKAGLVGFSKSLALETAKGGVTVNCICPGYIATEMVMAVPEKVRESIIAQIPAGRLGEPEEIARCVVFLASDDAGFINGSTISANGGQFFV